MKLRTRFPEVVRAEGSRLYLKNKPRTPVIDAISSWWVITSGHCDPRIVKALLRQAQNLDQVLFANFSHQPAQELAAQIKSVLPKKLAYLFFSDDGSTAVECALKMALGRLSQNQQGHKNKFIAFTHSYHGDTTGAMSVSGRGVFNQAYKKMLFSVLRVRQGRRSSDPVSAFVDDFEKTLKKHHRSCAGVIIEPLIQGAGGMIMWPLKALKHICLLTKKYGLYLIFDEVMTGFGRTGSFFAFEQIGITPDILCLSKGLTGGMLPLGLTVSTQDIYRGFLSDKKEKMFFHGHSFTANPLSCAAAVASMKILKQKSTQKNWQRIQKFHQKEVAQIKNHPKVKDADVCGTIARVELRSSKSTGYTSRWAEHVSTQALKEGVFLRPLGNIAYILPPYCTSNQELQKIWSVLKKQISKAPLL